MGMTMRLIGSVAAAAMLLTLGAETRAQDHDALPVAPDDLVYCTVCHGVQLMGNRNIDAPRLSGMDRWYVEQQLTAFKNGWRGAHPQDLVGMEMRPMAAALSAEQIAAAAEFVHATRSPKPIATVSGDVTAGKQHYTPCAACHGYNAEGNESLRAPALTGLDDWYLIRQLENYKSGIRGGDPADTYGRQMQASAALLTDEQAIRDIVSYITTIESTSD